MINDTFLLAHQRRKSSASSILSARSSSRARNPYETKSRRGRIRLTGLCPRCIRAAGESIVAKGRQCLFAVLNLSVTFRGGEAMQRLRSLLVGVGSFVLGVLFLSIAGTNA